MSKAIWNPRHAFAAVLILAAVCYPLVIVPVVMKARLSTLDVLVTLGFGVLGGVLVDYKAVIGAMNEAHGLIPGSSDKKDAP